MGKYSHFFTNDPIQMLKIWIRNKSPIYFTSNYGHHDKFLSYSFYYNLLTTLRQHCIYTSLRSGWFRLRAVGPESDNTLLISPDPSVYILFIIPKLKFLYNFFFQNLRKFQHSKKYIKFQQKKSKFTIAGF